jgi:hypothetical protein
VLHHPGELDDVPELLLAPTSAHMGGAERIREVAGALGERRELSLERAIGLLAHALDALELRVHLLERVLERPNVPGQARVRELEQARGVLVQRLGRQGLDGRLETSVEHAALDVQRRFHGGELALERYHLVGAPAALDERRAQDEEDADCAHRDPEEEGEDDHWVDER